MDSQRVVWAFRKQFAVVAVAVGHDSEGLDTQMRLIGHRVVSDRVEHNFVALRRPLQWVNRAKSPFVRHIELVVRHIPVVGPAQLVERYIPVERLPELVERRNPVVWRPELLQGMPVQVQPAD